MDGGPFRAPQPVERRVPSRQESAPRQAEEPQPIKETSRTSIRSEVPKETPKRRKSLMRVLVPLIIIVVILGLGYVGWSALSKNQSSAATGIDASKYQAVFFNSGEIYFGNLKDVNDKYVKLTGVYYLQSTADESSTSGTQSTDVTANAKTASLVRLSDAVYGPENDMMISKDQISRYMNLKSDGKVVQLINKSLSK